MYCRQLSSYRFYQTSAIRARGPVRFDGWYPRDHQPGPYPLTADQHRRAALKYGLRPEDYKPIDPNNAVEFAGDYPDLGIPITYEHKDPYEDYAYRSFRRNWAEPVQMNSARYRPDRYTFSNLNDEQETPFNVLKIAATLAIPLAIAYFYFSSGSPNTLRYVYPAMPKQYNYDYHRAWPWNDPRSFPIVNYTFESNVDDDHHHHHKE